MKHLTAVLFTCFTVLALSLGCSAKHEAEVDLLKDGFSDAQGEVKTQIDTALAAIKAEKYEEAVDALAKLEGKEMTDEQKQAIADVLVDIQTILTEKDTAPELLEKTQNLMMNFM